MGSFAGVFSSILRGPEGRTGKEGLEIKKKDVDRRSRSGIVTEQTLITVISLPPIRFFLHVSKSMGTAYNMEMSSLVYKLHK